MRLDRALALAIYNTKDFQLKQELAAQCSVEHAHLFAYIHRGHFVRDLLGTRHD